jgi:putative NADH-flavin reductase
MHNKENLQKKNAEDYGCNTQYNDSHEDNVTVPSGSKLYNWPFLVPAVSFETSEYTFVYNLSTREVLANNLFDTSHISHKI